MTNPLFDPAAWLAPFGLVRAEWRRESHLGYADGDLPAVVAAYAVAAALDVCSLPLALFWVAGVGRD